MKQKLEVLARCDVCDREIYACDDHYELPDGTLLCGDDYDCLYEWAQEYKMPGVY